MLSNACKYAIRSILYLAMYTEKNEKIGACYYFKEEYKKAINHLHVYIEYHEQKGDSIRLTNGLFQLGKAYKRKSDFDESLAHLYRSVAISEKIGDKDELASAYNVIANINRGLKNKR